MESIKEFWINFAETLKNGRSDIWVPIVFIVLIAFAFLVGFIYRLKWTIFKVASIVLTMIISGVAYAILVKTIKNSQDPNVQSTEGAIPFIVSIIALLSYWTIRGIFFTINGILHLIGKARRKAKIKKLKLIRRVIFGATNAVATIPGALLFSDILLVSSKKESGFKSMTSTIGVQVMTSGKGESFASLLTRVENIENLAKNISNVKLFASKYSELTPEEQEQFKDMLSDISSLINDKRVFKVIAPILRQKAKEAKLDEQVKDIVDKAISRMKADRPEYLLADDKEKKEIASKYIKENMEKLYNEAKTLDPEIEDKIQLIQGITSNLEKDTKKAIVDELDQIIDNEELRKQVDINQTFDSLLTFLQSKANKESRDDNQ